MAKVFDRSGNLWIESEFTPAMESYGELTYRKAYRDGFAAGMEAAYKCKKKFKRTEQLCRFYNVVLRDWMWDAQEDWRRTEVVPHVPAPQFTLEEPKPKRRIAKNVD